MISNRLPLGGSVIELPCPSVCCSVCLFAPTGAVFFRLLIGPEITWSDPRPLIGPPPPTAIARPGGYEVYRVASNMPKSQKTLQDKFPSLLLSNQKEILKWGITWTQPKLKGTAFRVRSIFKANALYIDLIQQCPPPSHLETWIGATIRIGREIHCLPYAGFFYIFREKCTFFKMSPKSQCLKSCWNGIFFFLLSSGLCPHPPPIPPPPPPR